MSPSRNVEQQEFAKLTFSVEFSEGTMPHTIARELKLVLIFPLRRDSSLRIVRIPVLFGVLLPQCVSLNHLASKISRARSLK
jgi:hypothetical protein